MGQPSTFQQTKIIVSGLFTVADRVLLLRRAQNFKELDYGKGLWDLPGGQVEFGEQLEAALQRELAEETGWRDLSAKLYQARSYLVADNTRSTNRINLFYHIPLTQRQIPQLSKEHISFAYPTLTELNDFQLLPEVEQVIRALLQVVSEAQQG